MKKMLIIGMELVFVDFFDVKTPANHSQTSLKPRALCQVFE